MLSGIAIAQRIVTPPPKPPQDGPSLQATMKFIQDKLKGLGNVHYATKAQADDTSQWADRFQPAFQELVADPSTCELTSRSVVHGDKEYNWTDNLNFREVEKIEVMPLADFVNREHIQHGNPELLEIITPTVFSVNLVMATGKTEHHHFIATAKIGEPSLEDTENKTWALTFPDEETANRVAKAMVHAVEMCGGGNKEPF